MKLYIITLGEFDIRSQGKSILIGSSRTYKIFKLFEYFLTFRNKKLLPETIIDNLLTDSESHDPKNMLRTQIFRLRKVINSLIPEGEDASKFLNISFNNGYYCLEIGENIVIDIDEFENFIEQGDNETCKEISMEYYQKAIDLYKGLYLSDNAYEVWLVPTRNYYHRLFLKTLYKYIEILKGNQEYEKIVTLCEETLLIEPYEERIHIEMMEALLKLGQGKAAANHYDHALNMLEKELDAKPSQRFIDFIKKIQSNSSHKSDLNIIDIKRNLEEEIPLGAMSCSIDYFKFLFNLQKRKALRNNQHDYLCILTINREDYGQFNNKGLKDILKVLERSLRKGDAFAQWNENQVLILLHDVKEDGIETVKERLLNNIREYARISLNSISIIFQPLATEALSF
ncbi:MAG TPA: hypothetical protein GX396_07850 [Tissierellia bacterium]|nr:hypothetical protein [Tissierellia bacterium]